MRRAIYTLVLMLGLIAVMPQRPLEATPLLQDQGLQGKTILFGISNGEADPFDRGDPGASRLGGLLGRAGATIRELNWGLPIPPNTDLVVLIGPADDYTGAQIARLWTYLEQGGSLLLMADPPGENGDALPEDSGLFELFFSDYGLRMLGSVLVNPVEDVPPPQPLDTADPDGTPFPTPTPLVGSVPVELMTSLFSNNPQHPTLINIDVASLALSLARPIEQEAVIDGAVVTSLLYTTSRVYAESEVSTVANFGVYLFDNRSDTPQMSYLVGAASEDTITGTRLFLIGDGDIGRNGFGFVASPPGSESFVFPQNIRLILNAIYWLVDSDPNLVSFTSGAPVATGTPTLTPTPLATPTETPSPG